MELKQTSTAYDIANSTTNRSNTGAAAIYYNEVIRPSLARPKEKGQEADQRAAREGWRCEVARLW